MKQEIKERVEKIRNGEVPEGYKETKVGIISRDWDVKELNQISIITRLAGYEYSSIWKETKNGEIIALRGFNIGKNKIIERDFARISNDLSLKLSRSRLYKNDVIYPCVGTIGNAVVIEENDKYHIQQNIAKISPNISKLNPKYLAYYLMSDLGLKEIYKFNGSSSQPNILVGSIRKYSIGIPSNPEQEKIAKILSTWDQAIEIKEKLLTEKKTLKRGLMQKLLTGEMRFPEFTDEWKKVVIGDIFEEVKRINDDISMDIDILTISAKHGFLSQKDKFNRVIAGSSLKKYTHLFQNEFAYNKGNSKTAPFGCIFKLNMKEGMVPFVYICFRPTQMIDVDYFDFYFKHGLLDRQLKRIITSGARSDGLLNVSKDNFFNIKIPLPSIEEQKKVGLVLRLIQNDIDYLIDELNQLKEQKIGLMQLLLTGIVRVEVD